MRVWSHDRGFWIGWLSSRMRLWIAGVEVLSAALIRVGGFPYSRLGQKTMMAREPISWTSVGG